MSLTSSILSRSIVALALTAASSYAIAQQSPTPSRFRGVIEKVDGDLVTLKSRAGQDVKLHMASNMVVLGVTKISLSDIKVGSFIGATTVPGPDGGQKAVEVHVFPENMRGAGEGSQPWDSRPNSTMTNATVAADAVAGNDGHTLTVRYKGGEKKVEVTPDTPVVTFVPGEKSELKSGAQVVAFTQKLPDGSLEAGRIAVGRDGLTPPM